MTAKWIELVTGPLEQKKQWRESQRRIETLAEPYGTATKAVQRYLTYYAGVLDGDTLVMMNSDLVDLFERAATDGTPVRDIVGAEPVEFAEAFAQAYAGRQWIDKERVRLGAAFDAIDGGAIDGGAA